jgi:tRNA(Ile)-lysidine synthase
VLEQAFRTIEENRLLHPGETVVVGVSGGPDSLCLLHLLCGLRQELGLSVHVAHLHHGLRGADADDDARFVQTLAEGWGLPCTVERADVPALARELRLAAEEAARCARYSFLIRVAEATGSRTIAVGHTADDQAETVLMHWLRGAGLAGLRGMPPSTPLVDFRLLAPAADTPARTGGARLIRPLLEVTRAEIVEYCAAQGLEPRFDRTNLDTTHFRNWLRCEVLPLLASHNPNVREVIRRSARVIADDYALLRSLLEEARPRVVAEETAECVVLDLAEWRALPTSLQRAVLREAIHRLRRSLRNISFVHVEDALAVARDGCTGQQATLPQGLMLTLSYGRATIAEAGVEGLLPDWPLLPARSGDLALVVPGVTLLPGSRWELVAETVGRADLPAGWDSNADVWRAVVDARPAGDVLWLRTRYPGDRFRPLGMEGHTVKVSNYLTNAKVPRGVRDRLPLLLGKQGILWVCGRRVDEAARVTESTERALVLFFRRVTGGSCCNLS